MKRNLLLVLVFGLLGLGAGYLVKQNKKPIASTTSWDMEFAVTEKEEIHKIFLTDRNNAHITLEREGDHWTYNKKYTARPTAIENLLTTIQKVQVDYIPTKASQKEMINSLATQGIKVEIYNKAGKAIKKYYVGGGTNDEKGTYLMMEGSEQPYVGHIPTFVGQIRTRYMLGEDDWKDRRIFNESPETIQSITVDYPLQKNNSFVLNKTGEAEYKITPFYPTTPVSKTPQRKGMAEAYLLSFETLTAEAFENINPDKDSIKAMIPFVTIAVKKTTGEEKKVKFFPRSIEQDRQTGKPSVFRYFADCSNGEFMLVQQPVFGKIFRGYDFFFENGKEKVNVAQ